MSRFLAWIRQADHHQVARQVLRTPPICPTDDRLVLFSMIGTKVVLPYLVAAKSLHSRLGMGRVVILDDGTLTAQDRRLLSHHLGEPAIYGLDQVQTGDCPRGGCWERLLTLLDLSEHDYVIQLDSDTVTIADLPEIRQAVRANRSFTLLGEISAGEKGLMTLAAFSAACRTQTGSHIQQVVERQLDRHPEADSRFYVRGCAGFAGFARGCGMKSAAEAFSRFAQALVGPDKWASWGSEQITSNYVVANSGDPLLLPYSRYRNYWGDAVPSEACFLHFVGTYRYAGPAYRDYTAAALTALASPPARLAGALQAAQ
jgi:hypothetical protein